MHLRLTIFLTVIFVLISSNLALGAQLYSVYADNDNTPNAYGNSGYNYVMYNSTPTYTDYISSIYVYKHATNDHVEIGWVRDV